MGYTSNIDTNCQNLFLFYVSKLLAKLSYLFKWEQFAISDLLYRHYNLDRIALF